MTPDDDLAKLLPEAPPRPDRREAAIAEAMRRFDGEAPTPAMPARRPSFAWPRIGRAPLGALASLALVAIIGVPVALNIVRQEVPVTAVQNAAATNEAAGSAVAPRAASEAPAGRAAPQAARSVPEEGTPPSAVAAPSSERQIASEEQASTPPLREGVAMAPSPAAPPPPPPPPPPPAPASSARGDLSTSSTAALESQLNRLPQVRPAANAAEDIVVTGSRVARPDLRANSPIVTVDAVENDTQAIVLTGSRIAGAAAKASERGDWNACTVIDPARSLAACKSQLDPGAKGTAGRAAAYMAQGLTQGWQGDLKGAVAAFDAAIEIEPKRAFGYLNRGIAYAQLGQATRAIEAFDQAVRHARNDPRAYYHRAIVLRTLGQDRRAKEDEDRAARLNPRYEALHK